MLCKINSWFIVAPIFHCSLYIIFSDENTQKLSDEVSPRLWYRRDVEEYKLWQEVQLGMDAPLTANHVYTTSQHSLVIQDFQPREDAGRYECRGLEGDDLTNPIAYLLDGT
jgi:hypothetical protein